MRYTFLAIGLFIVLFWMADHIWAHGRYTRSITHFVTSLR